MATNPSQEELLFGTGAWVTTTNVDSTRMNEELDEMAKAPAARQKHDKKKGNKSESHHERDKK
ncbi:hypothetical protein PG993_013459 [Apiospora rasikravindrae]|uniref:Uncharacterized protein n=1 Tax=Apiospora rasikravindrae TaxID=990691 RepID=A0ABR1RXN5_9PEZI